MPSWFYAINWCPCIKTFPPFDSTESRRHKLCPLDSVLSIGVHVLKHSHHLIAHNQEGINYARRIQHVIKMTNAQSGSILYILSPHYINKRIFNDTTLSSGINKKQKASKRKHPSCFLCVSHTVLFLTLNILRLSAMSQIGHKPMFRRPALLPS